MSLKTSTADGGSKAPLNFSGLPTEIRLMIWKYLLPPKRDLRIGCRIDNTANLQDPRLYTDFGKIASLTPPERYIAHVCRESQRLVHEKGSFQISTYNSLTSPPAYVDKHIGTVFMSLRDSALLRFSNLASRVDSIATLWPEPRHLENLHQALQQRATINGKWPVKTIYVGISAIAHDDLTYRERNSGVLSPLYGEADFKVFELDDPRVPGLLDDAWVQKETGRDEHYHRSTTCFLEHLKRYWEDDDCAKQLRLTWETLTSEEGTGEEGEVKKRVIVLKPAIVFSQRRPGISYGTCHDSQLHRWQAGLLFRRSDIFAVPQVDTVNHVQMERTPDDCQGFCRGTR